MVKKFFRKTMATSMAAVLACGMIACGTKDAGEEKKQDNIPTEAPEAENNGTTEEESPYPLLKDENGNVYDLGGMEVIIRDWWSSGEEPEPQNAYDEARKEYLDWIQDTYNFTIKMCAIGDWASAPGDLAEYASAGGDENYIFTVWQGTSLTAAMNSGLLYDLSELDCLDFTEKKWVSGVHNLLSDKDGSYGMNANTPEPRTGVFFNKRLIREAGYEPNDIYKWQESGEWTWEKFVELCDAVQRDIDNDGVIDVYGETSQRISVYSAAVYSNCGEFVGKDENGNYVNELESAPTLEALNWGVDFINNYELPVSAEANWDYYVTAFREGKAAFCVDDTYRFNDFSLMEDDWGFVCFPKGPRATDYTNVYQDNVLVIPACYGAEKAWKLAFAYNLYTNPIPGYEDYEGWQSGYMTKSKDIESVELTLARMVKNGMVTYHSMVPGIELGEDILWTLGYPDANGELATPAQRAEALRNAWETKINEANK